MEALLKKNKPQPRCRYHAFEQTIRRFVSPGIGVPAHACVVMVVVVYIGSATVADGYSYDTAAENQVTS
jgi:hypothetical protein